LSRSAANFLSRTTPAPQWLGRPTIYLELSKAKLSILVVFTAAAGYLMAPHSTAGATSGWREICGLLTGVALAAFGANALNQVMEARRDALMQRTRRRPLPANRIGRREAAAWGVGAAAGGVLLLAIFTNSLTAALALANILIYLLIYTPLKPRSSISTLVGAAVGAMPPVMGWTAAAGSLGTGALMLAAILFIWQVPHFLALAQINADDYAAGGFRMLPNIDPSGRLCGKVVLVHSLALLPVTLAPALAGLTGGLYVAGALALGLGLLTLALRLARRCDADNARRLFLASVIYLPLLLALMAYDRLLPGPLP
jgi:protoheme IX farnesyltransferase